MNGSHSDEANSSTTSTNTSFRRRPIVTFKKDFRYNSVDPIFKQKLETLEVYPVPQMNKKTKILKTSFEISASSSNYHVMNENVRDRTPIYTNKNNRSLATYWPKVKKINSDTTGYEKKMSKK